jgi:hypothetical protein
MTSLTIELTPEIYDRLRAEAQRQGKAEHEVAEAFLAERLTEEMPESTPLYLTLAPEVQALLATMTEADMVVPPRGTPEDAIRLLQSWSEQDADEEDEEGEGTWEDVLHAIDANRTSYRKLFSDLEQS